MKLSKTDLQRWVDAVSAQPSSPLEFMPWVEGPVRAFFPFGAVYMAHGGLVAGQIQISHWLSSGHELRYLKQLANSFELELRGSLAWWLANRQPFCIDPDCPPPFASRLELDEIRDFGLRNVAAHGILNLRANAGTYFSFAGIPGALSDWHLDALRVLAPAMNDRLLVYLAAQPRATGDSFDTLTRRQRDIVRQVATGLDDKTVARRLGVSEKTVRNQLSKVYARLDIHRRAQLLALLR